MNTSSLKIYDIAIVGGGFSGVAVAYHLQKESLAIGRIVSCILFEPCNLIGAGIAYGTQSTAHLLNVPASKMSIDDQEPDAFVNWLTDSSYQYTSGAFVPRYLYQNYLSSVLIKSVHTGSHCEVIKEAVYGMRLLSEQLYCLETDSGTEYKAKHVVLALGNCPIPKHQAPLQETLGNPWDPKSINSAARTTTIAIIGTGLSAVDTVLALEERAFKGCYTLISRKGLLPKAHPSEENSDSIPKEIIDQLKEHSSLKNLLRAFRHALSQGVKWHNLMDALRPYTQDIWGQLTLKDQQRFIKYLRSYWDSHRHRVPRKSIEIVHRLKNNGRLQIIRGRVVAYKEEDRKLWVTTSNNRDNLLGPFDAAFNCMGLWSNLRSCESPLIESIIDGNLGSYDALDLGLRTTSCGELVNNQGHPISDLYTLGSLRRGELWETTAAREIRTQARDIARAILDKISKNTNPHIKETEVSYTVAASIIC